MSASHVAIFIIGLLVAAAGAWVIGMPAERTAAWDAEQLIAVWAGQ